MRQPVNRKLQTMGTCLLIIGILISASSCKNHTAKEVSVKTPTAADSAAGIIVADTIIYDVTILNEDPNDPWGITRLSGLHHQVLIDSIFSMVYNQKAEAFDHVTGEKLTLKQVQQIESQEGFSRDNISMIQFTEIWYMNTKHSTMTKKVLSMVLGYNFYASNGELFGHKPVFRIALGE